MLERIRLRTIHTDGAKNFYLKKYFALGMNMKNDNLFFLIIPIKLLIISI